MSITVLGGRYLVVKATDKDMIGCCCIPMLAAWGTMHDQVVTCVVEMWLC